MYGGVAQLARALGSYPSCHRFESSRRYHPEEAAMAASSGPALIPPASGTTARWSSG